MSRGERVDGGVEAPLRRIEAEAADHLQLELLLPFERERDAADRTLPLLADCRDERYLLLLDPVEDRPHLGRLHPWLEVVEEHVVRIVVVVEALDVAAAEIEVVAQRGEKLREVLLLPGLHPHGHCERGGSRHLGAQLGRNPARLLPVATDDSDQAGLVRVVVEGLLERRQLVQQPAETVGGERLVRDPPDRGELLGADAAAAGRHLHLLVPGEQRLRVLEIGDLADAFLQVCERGLHDLEPTRTMIEPGAHATESANVR